MQTDDMKTANPHIMQYQGSKRVLAPQILGFMPLRFKRMVEPFAGSAAMSIAVAVENRASSYLINDINKPLAGLLEASVSDPDAVLKDYAEIWQAQFSFPGGHLAHFYKMRDDFNAGNDRPALMLYLLARCVKGAVRYGRNGKFNQSPDKRRHGTAPDKLAKNLKGVSVLLRGRTVFSSLDYKSVLEQTAPGDVVYMDPPYQGVSDVRDSRYFSGVAFDEFAESLDILNRKGIDFLVSYDGSCGERGYGRDLPSDLGCIKIMLKAGLSSQELFLGRRSITYEALYVSRGLAALIPCRDKSRSVLVQEMFPEAVSW